MDTSGRRHKGLLTADDMARWSATYETPLTYDYHGWTVAKTGPWGQGPVFLQTLSLLKELDIASMKPDGVGLHPHGYGSHEARLRRSRGLLRRPGFRRCSDGDAAFRSLRGEAAGTDRHSNASSELRPGTVPGFEAQLKKAMSQVRYAGASGDAAPGAGEPTMAHLRTEKRGDTVHIDVIDRWGNMISATPSGGWLQSSPVVPELGFALNTRAQMFWLEPGLPTSMAPRKRPRTTLTPSLALFDGKPRLVFGTPGGDQQDQWQLALFLRRVHHGLNLQEGIDLPLFHTMHFPSSFYPREAIPGRLVVEESFGADTIETLKARGHDVEIVPQWSVGRLTAAEREPDGILHAAATPRLMQAYAIGRASLKACSEFLSSNCRGWFMGLLAAGAITGLLAGLFGVGGGAVAVPDPL